MNLLGIKQLINSMVKHGWEFLGVAWIVLSCSLELTCNHSNSILNKARSTDSVVFHAPQFLIIYPTCSSLQDLQQAQYQFARPLQMKGQNRNFIPNRLAATKGNLSSHSVDCLVYSMFKFLFYYLFKNCRLYTYSRRLYFLVYYEMFKSDVTRQSLPVLDSSSFLEIAATLFLIDSTSQQVSYHEKKKRKTESTSKLAELKYRYFN